MPIIASPTALNTAGNLIQSIRSKIPDVVNDPNQDGSAFSLQQLLLWINNTCRTMCAIAPVIKDWYAIPSAFGMDTYVIPSYWCTADQIWYDLQPLSKTTELDDLFTTKITARSWWFAEHSQHAVPRLHIWPACDRTAAQTTVATTFGNTDSTFQITNSAGFNAYGFLSIGTEIILYRNLPVSGAPGFVTNILRGQGGTAPSAHSAGDTVQELNIFFKGSRLPNPLTGVGDLVEVPQGLWPVIELGTIAEVREAEQDHQVAAALRKEFMDTVEKLAAKSAFSGITRQGLQVREGPPGPDLFGGRVFIP